MLLINKQLLVRFMAGGVLIVLTALTAIAQNTDQVSDTVRQQITDILRYKKTFTAAERKMTSRLIFANRQSRLGNLPIGTVPRELVDMSMADSRGMVKVDIKGVVTPSLLNQIALVGGVVENSSETYGSVRASIPLNVLGQIAAISEVRSIGEAEQYILNSTPTPTGSTAGESFGPYLPNPTGAKGSFTNFLRSNPAGMPLFAGALTSQGYISHRANQVAALGFAGAGVKVGVLSDSASAARVAALMASGDLGPGTTVLSAGSGTDEGTAMMEIVQDMAPGAQIYFATANGGQSVMASNIAALAAAGCTIIVDDITYFAEAAFQDGPIAQAVNTFTAGGGLYFSSAGNSGNLTKGTSGTWEGDFLNGGPVTGPIGTAGETGFFHNFGSPGSPQNFNSTIAALGNLTMTLKWSDPQGASSNDYDLFILNSTGTTLKAFSAASQSGTQDPFEQIFGRNCGTGSPQGFCGSAANDQIVVVLFSGAARALRLDTNRGALSIGTTGATYGHNAAANVITLAATAWNSAKAGTIPFSGVANSVETFSSDGPRKMFFNPNGTAITAGNFLFGTNGGTTLQKPDLTAADGVSTKTPGFLPFFGTSAAAPHAAGIAALVKSANPSLTGPQIRAILQTTALDNMAAGVDRDGGYGIMMALAAVQAAIGP